MTAVLLSLVTPFAPAQTTTSQLQQRAHWTAQWISHPTASLRDPAVFHFRKVIHLDRKPAHFNVDVSADNRFLLFVNGSRIADGPVRGDLAHWRYELFDLAPFLHSGDNVVAAMVWNFGIYAPLGQLSNRSAFLMQGDTPTEAMVNTNSSWQVETESGLSFIPRVANGFWFYWAADPGEKLDAHPYDWNWMQQNTDASSHWVAAAAAMRESIYPQTSIANSQYQGSVNPWALVPDTLPQMEFHPVFAGKVVRTNVPTAEDFPEKPVILAPHTSTEILLDRGTMVTAYPTLEVSGGNNSKITLTYTEALYDEQQRRANRNAVGNRVALGLSDEFLPDGGDHRKFTPLRFRTWRYLDLNITTGDAPLTLEGLHANFTAFPFVERAAFSSNDPELEKIWRICWRSARLDAHDTYMDTPFWEQLQYIDDTRIQALISYTVAGDDRLARQALHAFNDSRVPEGITQSRYPSLLPQFIPNFSLSYIDMLHDYWMYRPDKAILSELVPGTRPILQWFLEKQRPDGFLERLPYWNAIDSPTGVKNFPRIDHDGRSALVTLLYVKALQDAADLEDAFGEKYLAVKYRDVASKAANTVYRRCWNPKLALLADTPDQDSYSQHANIFGVLTNAIPQLEQAGVMRKLIAAQLGETAAAGTKMAMVSYHYQFYLSQAIDKSGLGQSYLDTLGPWHRMLDLGLTTTPEFADPTRSDTHAWSAHPIYNLLTIVAGIHPAAPGFAAVRIAPMPGALQKFDASMPHPNGAIGVQYTRDGPWADFVITLPANIKGFLEWNGKSHALHGGKQTFRLPVGTSTLN